MNIKGTIKYIGQTEVISEKFKKRDVVVTVEGQYPQHILLQATQDRCGSIDNFKVGDPVEAHYNLKGREWTNPKGEIKYFNTIEVWKLTLVGSGEAVTPVDDMPF